MPTLLKSLRPGSSGKGMGWGIGGSRFESQCGQKRKKEKKNVYLSKKKGSFAHNYCLQFAEFFEKDLKVECEGQHEVVFAERLEHGSQSQEVHSSTFSCVSNVQCVDEDAEIVNEIADSVVSSRALQDKVENKSIGGEPILSDFKHSISVEVRNYLLHPANFILVMNSSVYQVSFAR